MKELKETAVMTVAYETKEPFLENFLGSIAKQEDKLFTLEIFNDNIIEINKRIKPYRSNLDIKVTECNRTPIKIREYAINKLKDKGYSKIIFCDFDDTFDQERVKKTKSLLDTHEIVVNDVDLCWSSGKIIKNYFARHLHRSKITKKDLRKHNMIGFSNSAIRTEILEKSVQFPEDLIALDWYFFASLLERNHTTFFTSEPLTRYVQHENNTIGLGNVTREKLIRVLKTKILHYKEMKRINKSYDRLYAEYLELERNMENILNNYSHGAETKDSFNSVLWWGEI